MVAAGLGCVHYPGQPGSHVSTGPMDLAAAIRCFPDPFEGVLRDSLPRHPFHARPIRRAPDKKGPQPVPRLQHTPHASCVGRVLVSNRITDFAPSSSGDIPIASCGTIHLPIA